MKSLISLRKATTNDLETIWSWRNSDLVRNNSFNKEFIPLSEHQKWFVKITTLESTKLLIAYYQDQKIGVVRFDFAQDLAEINIYLDPSMTGKGFGPNLLTAATEWLKIHCPLIKKIIAKILETNVSSQKAFLKAGYKHAYTVFELDIN